MASALNKHYCIIGLVVHTFKTIVFKSMKYTIKSEQVECSYNFKLMCHFKYR